VRRSPDAHPRRSRPLLTDRLLDGDLRGFRRFDTKCRDAGRPGIVAHTIEQDGYSHHAPGANGLLTGSMDGIYA